MVGDHINQTTHNNLNSEAIALPATSGLRFRRYLKTKLGGRASYRRHLTRNGLVVLNIVILAATLLCVMQARASTAAPKLSVIGGDDTAVSPTDQLASANIALTVARLGNMPEATAVANQADSEKAQVNIAATSNQVVAKSQVVATSLKSRADIQTYTTKAGDTVAKIAAKFGVSTDSIIWSNNLNSGSVAPNQKLVIPPINGIIYVVKKGDTAASLADKFHSKASHIVTFNDAEIGGLKPGERIVIPSGSKSEQSPVAPPSTSAVISFPWGSAPVYGYNGYDYGYCTWYVASQIPVPSNWGNASTWSYYAPSSGWNVSSTPRIGSIAQTPYAAGGEGHVAIVEAVRGNMIKISDMNGLAGWGSVGTGWVPKSKFPNYIYR